MQLWLRAMLMLGLVTPLHSARRGKGVSARTVRVALDASLQLPATSISDFSLANRSLSPWTYSDSFDDSRIPKTISNAQCLTSGCLSLRGGAEDANLEAKPITHQVLVLYRVLKQRPNNRSKKNARPKYDFRLGTEVITVGCTCVRPTVLPLH